MRPWLVLLAACGNAREPVAPVAHHAPPAVPVAPAPTPDLRARVAVAGGGSWTDIRVDGTDDAARAFCERLVEREQRGARGVVQMTVARACAATVLPAAADTGAYRLVEIEDVASDDVSVDDLLAGHREAMAHATGHLVHVLPAADRGACDALKARFDAEDQRSWVQAQEAERAFLDSELAEERRNEQRKCADAQHYGPCEPSPGYERTPCDVMHDELRRVCNAATERRELLEQRRAEPRQAPRAHRTCEPR